MLLLAISTEKNRMKLCLKEACNLCRLQQPIAVRVAVDWMEFALSRVRKTQHKIDDGRFSSDMQNNSLDSHILWSNHDNDE